MPNPMTFHAFALAITGFAVASSALRVFQPFTRFLAMLQKMTTLTECFAVSNFIPFRLIDRERHYMMSV